MVLTIFMVKLFTAEMRKSLIKKRTGNAGIRLLGGMRDINSRARVVTHGDGELECEERREEADGFIEQTAGWHTLPKS